MHVLSVGLNHHTAPLEVRERAAVTAEHLNDALLDLSADRRVLETTILSTCNRTEVYCHLERADTAVVTDWLCRFHQLDRESISPYVYELPGEHAVRHAFRVAAGLDSMVLGEPQILGQMKSAFATAHQSGTTGKVLNKLFQRTFSVAKRIRTNTAIGHNPVSVAYAAVALAKQIFADVSQKSVVVIGAGETIELVCRHLYAQGVRRITVANRSYERAHLLAQQFEASVIGLHELAEHMPKADMVFSSTASTLPIIGKGAIERAMRARKGQTMFLVDLAVPRDIEPEVSQLNNVFLYSIDDLQQVVADNLESRQQAVVEAEKIVTATADEFMQWLSSLHSLPTLRALRQQANEVTTLQLEHAQRRLLAGEAPDEVLKSFAHAINQKLLHAPTQWLSQPQDESSLELTRQLFGLNDSEPTD